ncbi:hypothetical protein RB195_023923 [Necator americanus]|uniref:Uncharacterized protein n=1 Tax=Necator americanus TaxID=51031 RepID=A0ABR1ELB1_NECAM
MLSDADSFTKCIQDSTRKTLSVAAEEVCLCICETKSTCYSLCVARSTGDFSQVKLLRRNLLCQLQEDREKEWMSRAKEFEEAWVDKNPQKAYALLKQYSGKMKGCFAVLHTAKGVLQPFHFGWIIWMDVEEGFEGFLKEMA